MIGEIGGDAEERAAAYIKDHVTKPVVGYVAGFTAPEGKTMGHAGAIVSGSSGTAQAKKEALEAVGVKVGKTPSETAAADARDHDGPLTGVLRAPANDASVDGAVQGGLQLVAGPGPAVRVAAGRVVGGPGQHDHHVARSRAAATS